MVERGLLKRQRPSQSRLPVTKWSETTIRSALRDAPVSSRWRWSSARALRNCGRAGPGRAGNDVPRRRVLGVPRPPGPPPRCPPRGCLLSPRRKWPPRSLAGSRRRAARMPTTSDLGGQGGLWSRQPVASVAGTAGEPVPVRPATGGDVGDPARLAQAISRISFCWDAGGGITTTTTGPTTTTTAAVGDTTVTRDKTTRPDGDDRPLSPPHRRRESPAGRIEGARLGLSLGRQRLLGRRSAAEREGEARPWPTPKTGGPVRGCPGRTRHGLPTGAPGGCRVRPMQCVSDW
jgi:hypothetical protein